MSRHYLSFKKFPDTVLSAVCCLLFLYVFAAIDTLFRNGCLTWCRPVSFVFPLTFHRMLEFEDSEVELNCCLRVADPHFIIKHIGKNFAAALHQ